MPELQQQLNQPGTPPGLTGKIVKIDIYQAVSLRELRTDILGATDPVTVSARLATAATTLETKSGNNSGGGQTY